MCGDLYKHMVETLTQTSSRDLRQVLDLEEAWYHSGPQQAAYILQEFPLQGSKYNHKM